MRIGLIGRGDDGGLATMTTEFARHLHPHRTLVVDLGPLGRGKTKVERYTDSCEEVGIVTSYPGFDAKAAQWLLQDIDVLYSAEVWYWPQIQQMAHERGIKTVLHSMPELHSADLIADVVWVPTNWEIDRVPGARLMPVPIPLDRFPVRGNDEATTFLHVAAPAMLDRNGTDVVLGALPLISTPCTVAFRGIDGNLTNPGSPANPVIWSSPSEFWDVTEGADVLVYPRRYAGLSLPMQESLGRGMPIIATDLLPQNQWPGVFTVPVSSPKPINMKGGVFNVWSSSPNSVAGAIENLVRNPGIFKELSLQARAYAESISWDTMTPIYIAALEAVLA